MTGQQQNQLPGGRARAINEVAFESIWAGSNRVRARFQYNLEAARKDFLELMARASIARIGQDVLDIGFGNGMLTFLFDRSCRLTGTEFSSSAIRQAESRARQGGYSKFEFLKPPDSERLPFEKGTFDVVIASHVIEHVEDDLALLRESLRVVRLGGWLILIAPLDNFQAGVLGEQELINPEFLASGHFHVRNYNAASLVARVEGSGGCVKHQITSMQAWDWKVGMDAWRSRLAASITGRVTNRLLAAAINVPLALAPRSTVRALDAWLARRGFRPRQMALAVQKH